MKKALSTLSLKVSVYVLSANWVLKFYIFKLKLVSFSHNDYFFNITYYITLFLILPWIELTVILPSL